MAKINQLRDDFIAFASAQSSVRKGSSNANYVLLQVDNAADCVGALVKDDILIRNQSSQLGLSEVVRVSIGTPDEMQRLQQAMQQMAIEA